MGNLGQFKNKPNTTLLGLSVKDLIAYFKIETWPLQNSKIDLGNRLIELIPIPGHQTAAIAMYANETKILFSIDSFYPGRLYINDWMAFKSNTY